MDDKQLLKIIKVLNTEEKEQLMELLDDYERKKGAGLYGGSLWDFIRDTTSAVAHKIFDLFGVGQKYVRSSRLAIEENGNAVVKNIMLCKSPVDKFVDVALSAISQGKFQEEMKNKGYDEMFHLYMLVWLDNQKVMVVEKNQTINIQVADESYYNPKSTHEVMLTEKITFGKMLGQTLSYMGQKMYFEYDPQDNNCQVYLRSILRANEISTPAAEAFIMQDTRTIFNNLPGFVRDISRTSTDIAALFSHVKSWLAGGKIN